MKIVERAAAWLFPARWLFWLWIVPGVVNSVVLSFADIDLRSPYRLQYVSLSVIALWFGLANSSLIYWFAPGRGSDPRPLYRRMYRFAIIYPVFSTLLFYAIGSAHLWLHIDLWRMFIAHQ